MVKVKFKPCLSIQLKLSKYSHPRNKFEFSSSKSELIFGFLSIFQSLG